MDNAGAAVAHSVQSWRGGVPGAALVLVGPGNNGGDGLVCAEVLRQAGWHVALHMPLRRERDSGRFRVLRSTAPGAVLSEPVDVVIDALLGTGASRPLTGDVAETLRAVRAHHATTPVFAIDVPSGVNADTGWADPLTLPARVTVTLGAAKVGLYQLPAHELCGAIEVADIGIPGNALEDLHTCLSDAELVRTFLPSRPLDGHKGTFGKLLVLAGSLSYCGAPFLSSMAAARSGAGLIRLATPASVQRLVAPRFAEATFAPLPETEDGWLARAALPRVRDLVSEDFDCLLLGPGLGQDWETRSVVETILLGGEKLPDRGVIDADGLNILSSSPDWYRHLPPGCVLTPHAAEFGRLANLSVHEVLADRFGLARAKAAEWRQVVVAKGANTIVAAPDGRMAVDPGVNPLLGTAGTGDVLAGTIAGLLTQGAGAWEGAVAATRASSLAAENLSAAYGTAGMIASDLHAQLPLAFKSLRGD